MHSAWHWAMWHCGRQQLLRPCVRAVGQFRDLVDSCARDVQLQETLRKVLNFTARGWDAARQHAMRAVHTDNRMRIWCADDTMATGLLFPLLPGACGPAQSCRWVHLHGHSTRSKPA